MKYIRLQAVLVSLAILSAAALAEVLAPHELMARTGALDLETAIPHQFGGWTLVPNFQLVTPSDAEAVIDPDAKNAPIYSQELGRGYVDRSGNIVMLMVAYGPVQNYRLKAHRPEICYTAAGFRVFGKHGDELNYANGQQPLKLTRLIAQREARYEPISYWMRVGDYIATGVVDRQIIRLRYGLRGIIPDGALIRISTVGLAQEASFKAQDQFIRDLLAAIAPENRKFFTGS
ncbi:exosortase-associated protein EpsI, V-type [Bradyrhizobium genosp. P]|uniref:exosortase-associated protein EpsI, V-type n=1 Tax=Bradyrhizobium genosp. P TaxID=83641 RepID=UPI003CED6203